MRKWIPLFAAIVMFLFLAAGSLSAEGTSPSPSPSADTRSALQSQVLLWIGELSEQPQFSGWKNAEPDIVPLGPGTHCWLVTLRESRKPVGYMIVNATAGGGFALGEYGSGSHPAFDPDTLYLSLVRQGLFDSYSDALKKPLRLERIYVHPLLAVWKYISEDGQVVYMDAWTGEALPVDDEIWQRQLEHPLRQAVITDNGNSAVSAGPSAISASRLNEPFDAYETMPWLTGTPLDRTKLARLTGLIDAKAKIRYTANLYNSTVLFVWPAIGYHIWSNGATYIAFDHNGARYVPLDSLTGNGSFYR